MGILNAIGGLFGSVRGVVDEVHTSEAEKLELKAKLLEIQTQVFAQAMELEKADLEARARVVTAEAQSDSWLTSSWRPIVMLTFCTLIVLIAFGWMDTAALNAVPTKMWSLLEIGIGGYIASRGLEKIASEVAPMMKARDQV